jgi:hypothetical protein
VCDASMCVCVCVCAQGGRENSEENSQRTVLKGVLTRLSGSTGFQLINVSNAPIVLEGKIWNNLLVNKVRCVCVYVNKVRCLGGVAGRAMPCLFGLWCVGGARSRATCW